MQSFEGWFQDLQISVNECFENPESRTDVEILLQRLAVSKLTSQSANRYCSDLSSLTLKHLCHVCQAFLKSKDAERRLGQLKDQLQRGGQQVPPQQQSDFTDWLREQQDEVDTFKGHCLNRQKEMASLLNDLNKYALFLLRCDCFLDEKKSLR